MKEPSRQDNAAWAPSVYYAEILVSSPMQRAWDRMLDYQAWNPTFVDAEVTPVRGEYRSEGEVVLISKKLDGAPVIFYSETVKVVPRRHIVWYVYPKEGDAFRNFVDFGLTEVSGGGVRFNIYYYEQNHLAGELLLEHRKGYERFFQDIALAFKNHCEANRSKS